MAHPKLVPSLARVSVPEPVNASDLQNLLFAARRGLPALAGGDLVNVSSSIQRIEASLAAMAAAQATPAKEAR